MMSIKNNSKPYQDSQLTQIEFGGAQDVFYSWSNDQRPMIVKGEGIYLWDEQGNKYLDASSGPVTCNIGHSNPNVLRAMQQQAQELTFSFASSSRNLPNIDLAKKLTELAGEGFERALFVSGGSEAVDMAIKFCRQYRYATGEKKRNKLISCLPSYHGMTLGALAVSGDPVFAEVFGEMISMAHKIPAMMSYHRPDNQSEEEYSLQCAKYLEEKIIEVGEDSVLAFIIEPVGGSSSGAIAPPELYFNEIRRICDNYGVFLIYDEVMSGTGRTGEFLTSHLWPDARPDITVLAKGLGAGYAHLGAMLAPAALVDELSELTGFNYAHTYNASPLSCAVGSAVLNEITQNGLLENTRNMGLYLRDKLGELQNKFTIIGDVRGRGLLLAIELVASHSPRKYLPLDIEAIERFKKLAQLEGLLIYGRRSNGGIYGEPLLIAPPLNVTIEELDLIIEGLAKTIGIFEAELRTNGII
ncbi:MAG: aspartate aminotransferase family protein [Alphaproteobacteria bacterium]|nr:MAG: aspartate aminotransferase family protein [Alphaproteobacteria bacterium]